jgi:hypothetical protein
MPTSTRSKRAKQAREALTKKQATSASPTKNDIDVEEMPLQKRQKQLLEELRGPGAPRKTGEKVQDEHDPVGLPPRSLGRRDGCYRRATAR